MFVIEWLGPPEAGGTRVLDRKISAVSDLKSAILQAKHSLDERVDFPDGRPIAIRVVNEEGLQHWIGFTSDAEVLLTTHRPISISARLTELRIELDRLHKGVVEARVFNLNAWRFVQLAKQELQKLHRETSPPTCDQVAKTES